MIKKSASTFSKAISVRRLGLDTFPPLGLGTQGVSNPSPLSREHLVEIMYGSRFEVKSSRALSPWP